MQGAGVTACEFVRNFFVQPLRIFYVSYEEEAFRLRKAYGLPAGLLGTDPQTLKEALADGVLRVRSRRLVTLYAHRVRAMIFSKEAKP